MKTFKSILVPLIFSFLIVACETTKEAINLVAAPTIDKAIIGKWGASPEMVKASGGTNIIAYDFHADGTVIKNIVMQGTAVQNSGLAPEKFEANNGIGQLGNGSSASPIRKFTYSVNGDVLKLDSDDPSYGANGLHVTLYRVVE